MIDHVFRPNFFSLKLVGWFGVLSNKFVIFLYSIIILVSQLSIIFCLSSGNIYLSLGICLGIYLTSSFVTVCGLFCREFFETFGIFWYSIIMYTIMLILVHQ